VISALQPNEQEERGSEMREKRLLMRAAVLAAVIGLVIGGGVAYANHRFPDVPNNSFAHDAASVIADRGITFGCGGGDYCPDDFVTREEMAAFLERSMRVLTPKIIMITGTFDKTNKTGRCKIVPWNRPYESQALVIGSLSMWSNAALSSVDGRVQYRVNGGNWVNMRGDATITDSTSSSSFEYSAAPLNGGIAMGPGLNYEFSVKVNYGGPNTGVCQLTALITNRMPGQTVDAP